LTRAERRTLGERGAPGGAALARCLEPHDADEFLEAFWETAPLLVKRDEPGRFDDLLSEADVERVLCSGGLRYPAFRLVKAGARLEPPTYTVDVPWRPSAFTRTADVDRVVGEFEAGATIVLQGLHLHWPPLAVFCRHLESALGHPVQANAYYTPRGSQGLPVHHDTHDVFVLQVAGDKRWLVYEPALQLPLRDQRYSPELGGPGEAVLDEALAAGDTLYLPRGWLHEALTSQTDSLHVTVGVNVLTALDAVRAALDDCAGDVEFRRSVPVDGDLASDLLERLAARLEPDAVARRARRRLVSSRRPIRHGQLGQLRALDRLSSETLVERRPTVLADLELDEGGGAALVFEGKTLSFPAQARLDVAFAFTSEGPFLPSDLPGDLDAAGRLVLVRRLVREGFLQIAPRTGAGSSA
jgi:bifunctional lysine-specific demethylase and histidyl-hydroxylase NO66